MAKKSFYKQLHKHISREPQYIMGWLGALGIFFLLYIVLTSAPMRFPAGTIVTIEEGETISGVIDDLKSRKVLRSSFIAKASLVLGQKDVIAGDYIFKHKENLHSVLRTLIAGDYGLEPLSVTLQEGMTVLEMADVFGEAFGESFDKEKFIEEALPQEGYLFPDTYLFLPNVKPETIITTMQETFFERVNTIEQEIIDFGQPLEAVVIMASLLEKEARRLETRRKISGVLWNRLEIDMPLQVDAVFPYIIGKNTYEVTLDDLEYDSPYNTYKYAGLPVGPIANPSLDSILASVTPIESDYLFYLADRNGMTYFARDFEGHKRNRVLYLD